MGILKKIFDHEYKEMKNVDIPDKAFFICFPPYLS